MNIKISEIINIRRELHKIPELAYEEYKTSKFIADYLKNLGIDIIGNVAKTGIIGTIKAKNATKTLLLRADMDALELNEENEIDYKSQHHGRMHACGHDVHMAILLGTAKALVKNAHKLKANVKLMFQPGEEGVGGALPMIKEGVFENPKVDAAFAFHVAPDVEVGSLLLTKGSVTASPDNFDIIINGRGGHGGMPEKNIDSILIGSEIVRKLKNLTKEYIKNEHAVVTVCSFISGTNYNVMPDKAVLKGTFRSFSEDVRQKIAELIKEIAKQTADKYGAQSEVNIDFLYPSVINDEIMLNKVYDTAKKIFNVIFTDTPQTWGEDFSYISQTVPSCLALLGCGNKKKGITAPLHSSKFNVDEACIPLAVKLMTDFALNFD